MSARGIAVSFVFALGVLAGTTIAPVMANRAAVPDPQPAAGQGAAGAIRGAYGAELVRVVDGDTFEARVHLWPGLTVTTKVRLRGIDAPELQARCAEERMKAEDARGALAAMLAEGDITVLHVALDKYGGRVLADAATPRTPDVSQAMLATGAVRAYAGGRRTGWCG